MKIRNISNKIIGLGSMSVLPDEIQVVPAQFERHPSLQMYVDMKLFEVVEGSFSTKTPTVEEKVDEPTKAPEIDHNKVTEAKEQLLDAQIAAVPVMDDVEVGKLAKDLGVNPASCKDQADVRKKVTTRLKSKKK